MSHIPRQRAGAPRLTVHAGQPARAGAARTHHRIAACRISGSYPHLRTWTAAYSADHVASCCRGHRGRGPCPRVQEWPPRRRRDRAGGCAGRDLRLPGAERCGEVDDGVDAHHAAAADRGYGARGGARHHPRRRRGAGVDRRRPAGGGARSAADRPRSHAPADDAAGRAEGEAARARRRADRSGRADRRGGSQGRRLLGWDEASARRGAGARAQPPGPVPRRADHRVGSVQPGRPVGRGRAARARRRRDRVPHDAIPRGGRRPRGPRGDHRPGQDRRRGHAGGAQGTDRAAVGRGGAGRRLRSRRARRRAEPVRRRRAVAARPCRRAARQRRGSGRGGSRARFRRCARGRPSAAPAVARRRLPRQDRPQARSRRDAGGGRGLTLWQQTYEMARRSVLQTLRQPAMVIPPVLFPLVLMGINVSGLDAATNIPGFPTDNYLNFAIAFPFIQGSLFASINAGSAVARDVETGFLNRLALTPMQRAAMLLGHLSGVLVVAFFASLIYFAVGFALGLHVQAGFAGVLVLFGLAMLISLAFASVGSFIGLRTGSGEAVQGVFPLFFVFLFLSSSSLPRELIEHDWFRLIATYNPVSYLFEGLRSLILFGWQAEALAKGFGFAAVIAVIGLVGSASALRTRLART